MNNLWRLDQSVKDVCPIDGISIGTFDDKSTWRVDYTKDATDDQKKTAQALVSAFEFVPEDAASPSLSDGELAQLLVTKGVLTSADVGALSSSATTSAL